VDKMLVWMIGLYIVFSIRDGVVIHTIITSPEFKQVGRIIKNKMNEIEREQGVVDVN